jgi:DNA-binding NtrC family response regulator
MKTDQTKTAPRRAGTVLDDGPRVVPGLVLAWAPGRVESGDRAPMGHRLTVGRGSSATWRVRDELMSREHFEVASSSGRFLLRDLGSRNGTTLDGVRVLEPTVVDPGAVILAGSCVFVVQADLSALAEPGAESSHHHPGFAGRFHSPTIVRRLKVASHTGRHVLVDGESGTGKEIAASILHGLYRDAGRPGPIVAHNGACFASEEDAVATLFGVAEGGFTGVKQRRGAIESADRGTLFIDEVHNLPIRVQRSLLRFVEDGVLQRIGGAVRAQVDVRIIFGTNRSVPDAVNEGQLAHDLVARLHGVSLPPLRERRADIPDIFLEVLRRTCAPELAAVVEAALDEELMDRLVRRSFVDGNVRELEDLAAYVIARCVEGDAPRTALAEVLDDADEPHAPAAPPEAPLGSPYELRRAEIVEAYYQVDGNLTKLEQILGDRGISCSRRWLATYLERWGVRRVRRRQE